jgi:hypothetical protein
VQAAKLRDGQCWSRVGTADFLIVSEPSRRAGNGAADDWG